jgi:hypothetical protein
MNSAQPIPSSAAASTHGAASPSLELLEARQVRDALKQLLRREQAAMADFLTALADFDLRRGWEPLGHANLFAFLHVELRLSRSAAFYRKSAAELLQRFPEVIDPLREGRLCLSTIAELAKVLTDDNRDVVVPRFFGLSSREAQELVAELQPRPVPSTRMVVTGQQGRSVSSTASAALPLLSLTPAPPPASDPNVVPLSRVLTSELANGGGAGPGFDRPAIKSDEIVPITADIRRVHFNVGKRVVQKLEAARDGLSHAIPSASMEQVLEAALDLLLERQARARGLVKRPRKALETSTPIAASTSTPTPTPNEPPPHRRDGPREPIPAAVRRAVWARDGDHCTWPLDGGGCCGSTHRLELDHIIPWAEWGPSTVENLRVVCRRHNALAARQAFGGRVVGRYRHGGAARRPAGQRPSEH